MRNSKEERSASLKDRASRWFYAPYLPFVLLFAYGVVARAFFTYLFCDDFYFASALDASKPFWTAMGEFLASRYRTWSSRMLIEGVLVIFARHPNAWYVADALVMTLIPLFLDGLLNARHIRSVRWILCGVMALMLHSPILNSAGWIATTINYSWPLAMALLALFPVKRAVYLERLRPMECALSIPALLFAANQEQMCLILLAILGALLVHLYLRDRRVNRFVGFQLLLVALSLIFIATCPGNRMRFAGEAATWFPNYPQLSYLTRFELGFSTTGFQLMMGTNWFYLGFCLALFLLVLYSRENRLSKWIAGVPLISGLIFGPLAQDAGECFPNLLAVRDAMTQQGTFGHVTLRAFLPDLILLCACCCVLYALFVCCENRQKSLFMVFVMLTSLGSRVMIGFSPSIWASSERTCLFMYFGLVALTVMMAQELDRILPGGHRLRAVPRCGMIVLAALFFVESVL